MNFKKVFRGYDPDEVDKYIAETEAREKQIRVAQKERIDELSDENYSLRQQVKQYQTDEQAISKSLISSQNLAQELKFDAEKYSELVLSRAKIFYATWRAYSKTLIATLSAEEVKEFNKLQKKLEEIINAYEGKDVAKEIERSKTLASATSAMPNTTVVVKAKPATKTQTTKSTRPQIKSMVNAILEEASASEGASILSPEHARKNVDVTPSDTTMGVFANPISKVQEAADQVIDLRELTQIDQSLEDICAELGLTVKSK